VYICKACGIGFEHYRKKAFCTFDCRDKAWRAVNCPPKPRIKKPRPICPVQGCGKITEVGSGKLCNKHRMRLKVYGDTGETNASIQRTLKKEIKALRSSSNKVAKLKAAIKRVSKSKPRPSCKTCGTSIDYVFGCPKLYCSSKCQRSDKNNIVKRNKYRSKARKEGKAPRSRDRQRAKYFGVAYEPIKRLVVYDRDAWTCQLCGCKTKKENKGKQHDRAPTLDHIVPLSLGGSHTYDNVQTACLSCNVKKSNKSTIGQLHLFPNGFNRLAGVKTK